MAGEEELIKLIKKYNNGTATPEERIFLETYYTYFSNKEKISESFSEEEKQLLSAKIFSRIQQNMQPTPVISIYKRFWLRAAAAVFILFLLSTYFIINRTSETIVANVVQPKADIAPPSKTKATITLADGRTITLDSLSSGKLASQGNTTVIKTKDGRVIYNDHSSTSTKELQAEVLNTISNPRGSKVVSMILADGSQLWLNSGSSLTFPVAFAGNQRKVSITGEAYFEVAHNAAKPFIVSKGKMDVKVLGTHFNVNAYDDENNIKVTLLQGSVKVSNDIDSKTIKPGEQAVSVATVSSTFDNSPFVINHSPDLAETMSWRDNRFYFMSSDIKSIARQLSRWYGIDINVEGNIPDHFTGVISRNVNASEVFNMLQKTGTIDINIQSKTVTIKK